MEIDIYEVFSGESAGEVIAINHPHKCPKELVLLCGDDASC